MRPRGQEAGANILTGLGLYMGTGNITNGLPRGWRKETAQHIRDADYVEDVVNLTKSIMK